MSPIFLATLEYPPEKGGVARYLYDLHNGMEGASVYVFSLSGKRLGWISAVFEIRQKMKQEGSRKLAISHILPSGYIALLLKWFLGARFFVFVHGLDLAIGTKSAWKRFWIEKILRSSAHVIANSNFTGKLAEELGAKRNKLTVITPCVSMDTPRLKKRRQGGIPRLLTISRLVPRKNHKLILAAIAELAETRKLRWIVVGDGPIKKTLVNNSREWFTGDAVEWRGEISDDERGELYASADIFVLPSKSEKHDPEGFGIVYLEAALYGLPVIAGRGGGAAEAVLDGETGILIDPESKDELVAAIKKLIDNPDYAQKLGENGRRRVLRDFTCSSRREILKKIYIQN